MTILHELHTQRPDLLYKHEVYIDGGVTRGTDVLKALCLGARAVGLGRAFLYANSVWGEDGVRRVIESEQLIPFQPFDKVVTDVLLDCSHARGVGDGYETSRRDGHQPVDAELDTTCWATLR